MWTKNNTTIQIIKKGITNILADCIVNAANNGLWEGGGVCGAIFKAAGSAELNKACKKIGHCDTGNAVITPAFKLDAKYIIHAVGPVYRDGKHGEPSQLYDAYKNSLLLAKENDCHSIVFPLISAGIFGYPKDGAWRKAVRACVSFAEKNPGYKMDIMFAILDDMIISLGEDALNSIIGGKTEVFAAKEQHKMLVPSTKEDRIKVFNDTMDWINSEPELLSAIDHSKKLTKVYYEDDYPEFDSGIECQEIVTVSRHRSFEAAIRNKEENPDAKVAVMNFANAVNPGGGVLKGAGAQEECLCRCSTLYPLLYRRSLRDAFYRYHAKLNNGKATDTLIYTEDVLIIKTDEDHPKRMNKDDWKKVDIITIAAPDLRKKSNMHAALTGGKTTMNKAELFGYHVKRAIHMLTVAASRKADILILGAFGCGAFENDPEVVAKAYKEAISVFPKVFKRIEFAVYCSPEDDTNYRVFSDVLGQKE